MSISEITWRFYFIVLTVMGLTTNIYENNGSVQACANITHGYLEAYSAYVWYSTYSGSANGMQYYGYALFPLT